MVSEGYPKIVKGVFLRKHPLHSRVRDLRDCTLIRVGFTLLGRGEDCRIVDAYAHCWRVWSDLPRRG